MKIPRTANAVGHIDDDLITAAAESKTKAKRSPWLKWGSIAACFALLVIAGTAILPSLFGGDGGTINIKTSSRRVNLQLFGRGNIRQYMKNTRN